MVYGVFMAGLARRGVGAAEFRPVLKPIRGGWPKKEAFLAGMGNAVAGSLRG
jgi:hypothetical protein